MTEAYLGSPIPLPPLQGWGNILNHGDMKSSRTVDINHFAPMSIFLN